MSISKKKKWINSDGWRGYYKFNNEVAGANDTGSYSDSPCPSSLRKHEIGLATARLKKAKVPYTTAWCTSSNVFMQSQRVLVAPENRAKAIEVLAGLDRETSLLWVEKQ